MGRKKKEVNDGKQTLKQAKAAFKARGSTFVSDTEKRQLERGAILLQRAERIKESETRRKEVQKKKSIQDTKPTKSCLLGTQRVNDKFGYARSQFHLGAFLKPKAPVPAPLPAQEEIRSQEPWEDDGVDDDTLLDLAGESPVTTLKGPSAQTPSKATPSKGPANVELLSPSTTDDFGSWDDFLERSSQLARDLSVDQKPTPPTTRSFDRISSFTSADFDLSVDDLEELDWAVENIPPQNNSSVSRVLNTPCKSEGRHTKSIGKQVGTEKDMDRKLMPPPMIPAKRPAPSSRLGYQARPTPPNSAHGISIADLESLAGEDIQLSQFVDV
ncbi:hypothetical protein D6D06_06187 [Aureobasidium pullulans]|nr:hypothetical protein D6D06_06187 [Aureobasidium pullulans]